MRNILTSAMFAGAIAIATVPASAQPLHVDAGFAKSQPIAENVRFGGGGGFHGGGFGGRGFGGRGFAGGRGFGGRGFGGRGYYGGGYGRGFYGRGYGGYGYGGYGYGLATGALLGGALAYPYYYGGYYPSSYYDDNEGETVYQTGRGSSYCARRFKSYDPNSGTYLGNDGRRHSCG